MDALQNAGPNNQSIPAAALYAWRMSSTASIKRRFDEELAKKEHHIKTCDQPPEGLSEQIKYFKMLSELYERNVNLMTSVAAYLDEQRLNGRMSDEEQLRMYGPMVKWLENMERELKRVLGLETSEFMTMLDTLRRSFEAFIKELRDSFAAHPRAYGAAVGGAAGALLLHKYFTGICLSGKMLGKLGLLAAKCGACASVGWITAFACGALGAIFLLCAFKAICYALAPDEQEVQEEIADQFRDVHAEVENVKEALKKCRNDDLLREMNRIAAFWDHFEHFRPDEDDPDCPVCLEPLREPVLFRGCVGRHFHCMSCREEALATNSGGGCCSLCRQPRPEGARV